MNHTGITETKFDLPDADIWFCRCAMRINGETKYKVWPMENGRCSVCHTTQSQWWENFRAFIGKPANQHDDMSKADYEEEFQSLLRVIASMNDTGTLYTTIEALGSNYDELIESLNRLSGTEISLRIIAKPN